LDLAVMTRGPIRRARNTRPIYIPFLTPSTKIPKSQIIQMFLKYNLHDFPHPQRVSSPP